MLNALKKLDKKILIILGLIIVLPVLLIIFLAIIQGCSNKKDTYSSYENKMLAAAEKYFTYKKLIPTSEGQIATVELNKLVSGGYIKNAEDSLGQDSCQGSVSVRRNGAIIEENNGGYLNYIVNLKCNDYQTKTLKDSIMENLTTNESGLYQVGNKYIFKGDSPKNYITIFGKNYRIMGIEENGLVKLIFENRFDDFVWDTKYNVDVKNSYGKNIYKDSKILKKLLENYKNSKFFNKKTKQHIVANSVCVDSRESNDYSKDFTCTNYLDNQVVSLFGLTDYANASLDSDCNDIISGACRNYNYLGELNIYSWTSTAVSDNSYEVFYISGGRARIQKGSNYSSYRMVIYIDGNETYTSGNGSKNSPYVID